MPSYKPDPSLRASPTGLRRSSTPPLLAASTPTPFTPRRRLFGSADGSNPALALPSLLVTRSSRRSWGPGMGIRPLQLHLRPPPTRAQGMKLRPLLVAPLLPQGRRVHGIRRATSRSASPRGSSSDLMGSKGQMAARAGSPRQEANARSRAASSRSLPGNSGSALAVPEAKAPTLAKTNGRPRSSGRRSPAGPGLLVPASRPISNSTRSRQRDSSASGISMAQPRSPKPGGGRRGAENYLQQAPTRRTTPRTGLLRRLPCRYALHWSTNPAIQNRRSPADRPRQCTMTPRRANIVRS